ncbi:unnamed protein product, partial [Didymodactylos carnosus]
TNDLSLQEHKPLMQTIWLKAFENLRIPKSEQFSPTIDTPEFGFELQCPNSVKDIQIIECMNEELNKNSQCLNDEDFAQNLALSHLKDKWWICNEKISHELFQSDYVSKAYYFDQVILCARQYHLLRLSNKFLIQFMSCGINEEQALDNLKYFLLHSRKIIDYLTIFDIALRCFPNADEQFLQITVGCANGINAKQYTTSMCTNYYRLISSSGQIRQLPSKADELSKSVSMVHNNISFFVNSIMNLIQFMCNDNAKTFVRSNTMLTLYSSIEQAIAKTNLNITNFNKLHPIISIINYLRFVHSNNEEHVIIEFEEFIIWYHRQQEDILHSLTTINNVIEYFKQSSNNKQHNTENCMIKLKTELYQQLLEAKPDLFEPILSKIQTDMNDLWRSSSKIFNVIQHQTNLFDICEYFFDKSIDKPEHDISHLFNDKIRQFEKYLYHYDREN